MILESFRDRAVFVTGHTGFKGSWLAAWLHLLGAKVTGYALPPNTPEEHFCRLDLPRRLTHREGDIRDVESLTAAMNAAAPEIVFHLAAQSLVRFSYGQPKLT